MASAQGELPTLGPPGSGIRISEPMRDFANRGHILVARGVQKIRQTTKGEGYLAGRFGEKRGEPGS